MKKIEAVIRRQKLSELKNELSKLGVQGITVLEAGGFGHQRGRTSPEIDDDEIYLIPKYKLEIFTTDELVQSIIEVITKVCYSGRPGDGKIFILPVEDAMRIRTKERGDQAL